MRCPRCTHDNRTGARFCDECGGPLGAPSAGAERRHLAVVFADLVGSTQLSQQLDPEDLREILGAYHEATGNVVRSFGGHVAMLQGDGVISYFGFPHAQEHDVERAVRAGLGILDAVRALATGAEKRHRVSLAVRVAVHAGEVVVGQPDGLGADIFGDTPNVAARLQSLAAPNTVVISGATQRLAQGLFRLEELGTHALRGIEQPVTVFRVVSPSGVRSRLDAMEESALTPFVGREDELERLLACWNEVRSHGGRAVVVSGEAGIGKSRLVHRFRARLAETPHTWLECAGSPYLQDSAFQPVIELQASGLGFTAEDTPEQKLAKLERALQRADFSLPDVVPLFARLHSIPLPTRYAHALPLPGRYASLGLTPEAIRRKTKEAASEWLLRMGRQQPVVFFVEDLHWIDPSSLELIGEILFALADTQALMILTHRVEFMPPWPLPAGTSSLPLGRLAADDASRLVVNAASGRDMRHEWVDEIVRKTDGIPLFLEEMTKAALETGDQTPRLDVPATLKGLLMARLDQLGEAREAAQLASVVGREFSYALLLALWLRDEAALRNAIDKLITAELLYRRADASHEGYVFKHALVQDAAYDSLLKADRQRHHERIGTLLEERFPAIAEMQPELLAHHFTEAQRFDRAIPQWYRAGQQGLERSAHVEAARYLARGLDCVERLPPGPDRDGLELGLRTLLGANLVTIKGYAAQEVLDNCARALELCSQLGESPQIFPVLFSLWLFHLVRADRDTTCELSERMLQFADQSGDPAATCRAHIAAAITAYWQGRLREAREHALEARTVFTPALRQIAIYGDDPETYSYIYDGMPLWFLGHPHEALATLGEALALAERLGHAFTVAGTLSFHTQLLQLAGDVDRTEEFAERAITYAQEQSFPLWLAVAFIHRGWARVQRGDVQGGTEQIQQGLAIYRMTGAVLNTHYFLALLAEALLAAGERAQGLAAVDEGLALTAKHLDTNYAAELHRLKGELLLLEPADRAAAEACFRRALDVARAQDARFHELRAALSLARLPATREEQAAARALLAGVAETGGGAPRDRQEASRLLASLHE